MLFSSEGEFLCLDACTLPLSCLRDKIAKADGPGLLACPARWSCFWSCCTARWSYELPAFPIANPDQERSSFQDLNLVSIMGVTRLKARCWTEGFLFKLFLGVLFCCFSGFQFSLLLDLLFGLPGFGWLLKVYNFSALLRRSIFIFGRKEREKTENLSKCGPIYEPVFRAHLLLPSLIKVSFSSPLSGLIFQAPNL